MIEKLKLEIPLLLPENGECEHCVARLQETLLAHKGVAEAHVDTSGEAPRLCLHYDPNLISLAQVERAAREAGLAIQDRYRHRVLNLSGMDCADCALTLEKGVGQLDGVLWVAVNFPAARMRLEYDAGSIGEESIVGRIRALGYDVVEERREAERPSPGGLRGFLAFVHGRRREMMTLLAGLLIALAFALETPGVTTTVTHAIYAAAILVGGYHVARSGLAALWTTRSLDINFLMTVAAVGAMFIGEWEEGALVVFLFSLGETLESYTLDRARARIRSLIDLTPPEATRLRNGYEERVPVESLKVDDVILVRPGERIPMDGVIVAGSSAVNQAPITGESVPVEKQPGDVVFAGTINASTGLSAGGQGALEVRVTRLAEDNTLSRIIHMVEEAQAQKAPSQRFVDLFARYYTPAVVVAAVLIAALPPLLFGAEFLTWLFRALVLLVIACPCALVISTPVSIVSAISNAARQGVLIKGGAYLEEAGSLQVVAFDKTGTLTEGRPSVTDVIPLTPSPRPDGHPPSPLPTSGEGKEGWGGRGEGLLRLAAAVESRSEHPLAQAIVREARHRGLDFTPTEDFRALTGRGASGTLEGRTLWIGNRELFAGHAALPPAEIERLERLEGEGKTVMLLGDEGGILGLIAVADRLRPDAREAVAGLRRTGIRQMIMLTGDNERTARAIAARVGVDQVRAGLLPEEKVAALRDLLARHRKVAMVGDGVNDAPALAAATVGIAMGGAGTDQALETADIVLMADDLTKLPFAIWLSRQARRVIGQNIVFALLVKVAFLALALAGWATLWMAVFADVGASLIVIFNGMRLLRVREEAR
nr:heavy metal translocating P-type ATPase [Anaerolineae bacterium]